MGQRAQGKDKLAIVVEAEEYNFCDELQPFPGRRLIKTHNDMQSPYILTPSSWKNPSFLLFLAGSSAPVLSHKMR